MIENPQSMRLRYAPYMDIEEQKKLFQIFLRKKNLYLTNSRLFVLEAAARHQRPFEALTLWSDLRYRGIGQATIYRTLELLAQAKLIRKRSGKINTFECTHKKPETEYFHCLVCGDWIGFPSVALTGEILSVAQQMVFTVRSVELTVTGTCRNCRLRENRDQSQPNGPNREDA